MLIIIILYYGMLSLKGIMKYRVLEYLPFKVDYYALI